MVVMIYFELSAFRAPTERGHRPNVPAGYSVASVEEAGPLYQYFTAFHCSLAQLTLGTTEIYPQNTLERVFSVMLLVSGSLFGGTVVSSFSAIMMEFQIMKKNQTELFSTLRKFLQQKAISSRFAAQVLRQVKDRLHSGRRHLTDKDVPALAMLSGLANYFQCENP